MALVEIATPVLHVEALLRRLAKRLSRQMKGIVVSTRALSSDRSAAASPACGVAASAVGGGDALVATLFDALFMSDRMDAKCDQRFLLSHDT